MSLELINAGAEPNDGTGDPPRVAAIKINAAITALASKANLSAPQGTIDYASTVNLDLGALNGVIRTITLAGNLTITTSNRAAEKSLVLRLLPGAATRNLTFPGGWVWLNIIPPSTLAANKTGILSLTCFGPDDADIVASFGVQQ